MKTVYLTTSQQAENITNPIEGFPACDVILMLLTAFAVLIFFISMMIWLTTGYSPIDQIEEIFDIDISGFFEKQANVRDFKKYRQGDKSILLKRGEGYHYAPDLISSRYELPESFASRQEIFNFNLDILKYWMMTKGRDAFWSNISIEICNNVDIFRVFMDHLSTDDEDEILIPNELLKELFLNKEAFYHELDYCFNMKNYSRVWTPLQYSAKRGNQAAQNLLDWIDEQLLQKKVQSTK